MSLITRAEWHAKKPTSEYTRLESTKGVKIHYTGGKVPADLTESANHDKCGDLVRDIQKMHMSGGRGETYIDIGYSMVCCPHRYTFMGRGPHALPAANGAGLNSGHYAVLALVGSSGLTEPNDDLLHALVDAIEHLREHGDAGNEVKGHRDGFATSCPGDPLYDWVRRGAERP
ncbi:N-acetylmuramoyl-L-alanine amidase [Nonomuraea longispora]|uniref:N-acetylmuramoyl-L-alanine amidase n=1 Tax=Nonomuraea longispora TaxID=1848320 RepID=A0A4R4NLN9_9ACTN|nr:peptidoglycan recognition family protein [Nonomuraea longispora]TDC10331.1 N-acetylmuramoyl-L-alanine amidase [Nonomuraea longispora]